MKKGSIAAVAAALVALAMVVAGCGGDSDTAEALTRAQFTKEANAICKDSDRERATIFQEKSASPSLSDVEQEELVEEAFIAPYQEMIDSLNELGVPKGDEKEVEAIIQEMEDALAKLEDDPLGGLASTEMFEKANKLSSKYGLNGCVV